MTEKTFRSALNTKILGEETMVGVVYLLGWKSFASGKGNSDCWVEMSTRDVANRVNQNHHGQTPNYCNSRHSHNLVLVQIHHHRSTAHKYQEVCTHRLCNQLPSTKISVLNSLQDLYLVEEVALDRTKKKSTYIEQVFLRTISI